MHGHCDARSMVTFLAKCTIVARVASTDFSPYYEEKVKLATVDGCTSRWYTHRQLPNSVPTWLNVE